MDWLKCVALLYTIAIVTASINHGMNNDSGSGSGSGFGSGSGDDDSSLSSSETETMSSTANMSTSESTPSETSSSVEVTVIPSLMIASSTPVDAMGTSSSVEVTETSSPMVASSTPIETPEMSSFVETTESEEVLPSSADVSVISSSTEAVISSSTMVVISSSSAVDATEMSSTMEATESEEVLPSSADLDVSEIFSSTQAVMISSSSIVDVTEMSSSVEATESEEVLPSSADVSEISSSTEAVISSSTMAIISSSSIVDATEMSSTLEATESEEVLPSSADVSEIFSSTEAVISSSTMVVISSSSIVDATEMSSTLEATESEEVLPSSADVSEISSSTEAVISSSTMAIISSSSIVDATEMSSTLEATESEEVLPSSADVSEIFSSTEAVISSSTMAIISSSSIVDATEMSSTLEATESEEVLPSSVDVSEIFSSTEAVMISSSSTVDVTEMSSSVEATESEEVLPSSSSPVETMETSSLLVVSSTPIDATSSVVATETSSLVVDFSSTLVSPTSSLVATESEEVLPSSSVDIFSETLSVDIPEMSSSIILTETVLSSSEASDFPSSSLTPSTTPTSTTPMASPTESVLPSSSVDIFSETSSVDIPEVSSSIIDTPTTGPTTSPTPSPTTAPPITILPYLQFNTSISAVISRSNSSFFLLNLNPPRPIPILDSTYSSIHISFAGTFSLGSRFNFFYPTLFPSFINGIRNAVVFAPMWNDYEYVNEGTVSYQSFDSNNPLASRVFSDVNNYIRTNRNSTNYQGIWMLLIEWSAARPYPQGVFSDPFFDLHNTFQAVLTTDGSETHVIYIYKCGDIMWDTYHSTSVVGYNIAGLRFENRPESGIPRAFLGFGCGADTNFTNILYSFSSDEDLNEAACLERYKNDLGFPTIRPSSAPPCPSSIFQAWFDRRFRFVIFHSTERVLCYANRFPRFRFNYQSICCYDLNSFGALITGGPLASHIARFHPFFSFPNYLTFDSDFLSLCCLRTQNCNLFRERRPILTDSGYRPPRRSWWCCDPHINTLDDRSYTFNGLGEYVLLRTDSEDFEVQARTKLAAPNTTATVFNAIAVSESRRSNIVEVRINETDDSEFIVLYNGDDVTANLTSVNDTLEFTTLTVTRETTEVISIALSSGVGVNVTLRLALFSITLNVPQSYMGNTTGLLGNFDDDNTNDFTSRNGTMISSNSTDAQIFMYGQTWQLLNDQESLFTYPPGQSFADFSNASHVPIFLDDIDPAIRAEGERICGGSDRIQCIYDYTQTRNRELALDTQTTMEDNELGRRIENNSPPVIVASDTFEITVGETAIYTLNITDPGDTFNVTVDGEFSHTFVQDDSIWTLNVTHSSVMEFTFSVIATDSLNATSIIAPQVRICGCPRDRGNCTVDGVQNASSNPLILLCECNEAYDGQFCENDANGCDEVNCFNNAPCTDVPAPETGATCPGCPSGYNGTGLLCTDIDECSDNNANCAQFCNNTLGSFQCTCMSGFELASDGFTCNDINECQRLLDNCQQECTNTIGSFNCTCRDGFILQDDGRTCEVDPDRECLDPSVCEQFCVRNNFTGIENCSCESGFDLASNMINCTNIDECLGTNPCTQLCNDTEGSFMCSCREGFQLQSNRFTCTDDNECLVVGSCPEPEIRCVNTPGSFECSCPLGSMLQNGSCITIVEPTPSSSPSPSPTATPTAPPNSGVVIIFRINASAFNRDLFRSITAQAINSYCSSNECNNASSSRRRQTGTMVRSEDIVIVDVTPTTTSGLRVTFYVRGQSGVPVDAYSVRAAVEAFSQNYTAAGLPIVSIEVLDPTPTPTTSPTDDEGLSAGEIAGIVIGSVIGALLIIIILIIIIYCICKRCRGTGRYAFVEKGIPPTVQDDDFAVQNVYYEPTPPSPEGSVHSMKLKFAQESESSGDDDDDNDDEGPGKEQKAEKRVSQPGGLEGRLEKEMLEMSEETHL